MYFTTSPTDWLSSWLFSRSNYYIALFSDRWCITYREVPDPRRHFAMLWSIRRMMDWGE